MLFELKPRSVPKAVREIAKRHARLTADTAYRQCVAVSRAMAEELEAHGYPVQVKFGHYITRRDMLAKGHAEWESRPKRHCPHTWVEYNGFIIDGTYRQFGGKPALKITRTSNSAYLGGYVRSIVALRVALPAEIDGAAGRARAARCAVCRRACGWRATARPRIFARGTRARRPPVG